MGTTTSCTAETFVLALDFSNWEWRVVQTIAMLVPPKPGKTHWTTRKYMWKLARQRRG